MYKKKVSFGNPSKCWPHLLSSQGHRSCQQHISYMVKMNHVASIWHHTMNSTLGRELFGWWANECSRLPVTNVVWGFGPPVSTDNQHDLMCEELILLSNIQSWSLLTSLHMKVCQKMLQWMLLVTLSKRTLCMCKILTQNVPAAFCWECAAKTEIKLPSWLSKLWISLLNFHLYCLLQAGKEPWSKPALWW